MKKLLFLIISMLLILLSGCNAPTGGTSPKPEIEYYTITFRQDGQKDITQSVKAGESLADIPTPVQKSGYTIVWNKTDFLTITEDTLVLAVEKANEYTISFDLYSTWGKVQFDVNEQSVTFDSTYELETPSLYGFLFTGWEIKDDGTAFDSEGTYTFASDITLVPTWEKDEDSYRWWGHLI